MYITLVVLQVCTYCFKLLILIHKPIQSVVSVALVVLKVVEVGCKLSYLFGHTHFNVAFKKVTVLTNFHLSLCITST